LWIESGQVRSFVKIAINAGKSKIFDVIVATVNARDNVFDVERRERRIILMQMTIFASVVSALANLGSGL
jgi:hypothetical protein